MADLLTTASNSIGFGSWRLGLSTMGNFMVWLILSFIVCLIIIAVFVTIYFLKVYKRKVKIIGMVGSRAMTKSTDRAKIVRMGRAGDKLWWLRKNKRFIPPLPLQTGVNEFTLWEREDGELINVGFENLDEKMKQIGVRFIDSDMRLARLSIEKNLQYRHQNQTFWQKYGQFVINIVFYVFVTMLLIVLFIQWRKSAEAIQGAMNTASEVLIKVNEKQKSLAPPPGKSEGSGLIPALILITTTKFKLWRFKKNAKNIKA